MPRHRCPLAARKAARVQGGDPRKDGADGVIQSDIVREASRKAETDLAYVIPGFAEYPDPLS